MQTPAAKLDLPEIGQVSPTRRARAWYTHLSVQILLALMLGVFVGHTWPERADSFKPLGDLFIRLVRMLVAPIIFCTVVHGIASVGEAKKVGRVAIKSLIYFEVVTTIALVLALLLVNLWAPGAGMHVDLKTLADSGVKAPAKPITVGQFLLNLVPANAVGAFAEGDVIPVLFFSLMFAFGLLALGSKGRPLVDSIHTIAQVLFKMIGFAMWVAPIGAFGAIAFTVGKFGADSLLSLGKLLVSFYLTCLIFILVVLWPVAHLAGVSLFRFIAYIREELLIVIATTSSETVLPRMIAKLEAAGCDESVVGLVIPTGYSFNLDGTCLYLATAAVFLAQATDTPLPLTHQLELLAVLLLASKGAAGVAGAAFIVLAATLGAVGTIPVESVALILGVHRLMSQALTPTNLIGNGLATLVIARWERSVDEKRLQAVLGGPVG